MYTACLDSTGYLKLDLISDTWRCSREVHVWPVNVAAAPTFLSLSKIPTYQGKSIQKKVGGCAE